MSYHISTLAMRQTKSARRNQNTVRFNKPTSNLGPISNTLFLALILSLFGLLYLTQITKTSSFGYQVSDLKTKKEQLIQDNQTLEVEAARLQALNRIKNSSVAKKLSDQQSATFVE